MLAQTQARGEESANASEFFQGNVSISTIATGTLEADRLVARTCIQRAADVLGVDLNQTGGGPPPGVSPPRGGLAPWKAKLVKRYVGEHLSSSIRIATLAQMVQLSSKHFSRAFRCSFAETPRSYIVKSRVIRGLQLMLNSDLSLARIALEIGMCDQAHLCRTFRRVLGTSPSAWRRQNLSHSTPRLTASAIPPTRETRIEV